jgi:hypothetical protein
MVAIEERVFPAIMVVTLLEQFQELVGCLEARFGQALTRGETRQRRLAIPTQFDGLSWFTHSARPSVIG